ncbi:MAG: T9SS type A sorting domain-containing protein [Cryomorphaceae bacterium]|nr:T9SS type A sorting domain-containing protein [Cryomorphaceae bacterium]
MKHALQLISALFIFIASGNTLSAQSCIADAGNDYHWCITFENGTTPPSQDSVILGGMPSATGGVQPYVYTWYIDPIPPPIPTWSFTHASDLLNDTTVSNPILYFFVEDSLVLYLKVTDAVDSICYDTIVVTKTEFSEDLGSVSYNIQKGDTIQLFYGPNVAYHDGAPDSILWRPNHGLIDSNSIRPFASPEKDMAYYCIIWDENGCRQEGNPCQFVYVNSISNTSFDLVSENAFAVFPTILHENTLLNVKAPLGYSKHYHFSLYDIQGKIVLEGKCENTNHTFNVGHLSKGVYFYRIIYDSLGLDNGKIIVK